MDLSSTSDSQSCPSTGVYKELEQALSQKFIPSLFGHPCTPTERLLYSLPIRMGGLNIHNPVSTAAFVYSESNS